MVRSLLAAICALSVAQLGAAQHVLDLTRTVEESTEKEQSLSGGGCAGGSEGEAPREVSLEIALQKLDRADYTLGSRVVFDVFLRNSGSIPVTFPWLDKAGAEEVDSKSLVEAFISLRTTDDQAREHSLTAVRLQGSPTQPESVRVLEPGETAMIRVPGWLIHDERAARSLVGEKGREAPFYAAVMMSDTPCRWSRAIRSAPINVWLSSGR